jgi:GH24 family phage-related lysozyme (muramidase)
MIRLKQILESDINETPLSDLISGDLVDRKINVLFVGDAQTGDDISYANNLLSAELVIGDIVAKSNIDVIDLAKIVRRAVELDNYDVISILIGNSINKTVPRTTKILEEIFKFAKQHANRVIAITNPISFDIDSAEDSELQELQELSEWVASQRITDDVIDLSEFNSSYFESDGTKLNSNGQRELSDKWYEIVKDYDIEPIISYDAGTVQSKKQTKTTTSAGPVYTDTSDIVSGANFSDSLENQATRLLARFEGFSAEPGWDVNAWRIGHGSSTITTTDGEVIRLGNIRSAQPNIVITREDAARDLKRRLENEFIPETIKSINSADLPDGVIAALVSIAYNYGSLPNSIRNAAKSEDIQAIADAIRAREGDNGGVNKKRRNKEANYVLAAGGETVTESISNIKLKKLLKR